MSYPLRKEYGKKDLENDNMKAPWGIRVSLWSFFLPRPENHEKFHSPKEILYEKERRVSMDTRTYFPSRRGFLKGLAVGAGGYALGSFLIHPNEARGQSIESYLEKVPMEARWDLAASGLVGWQVNFCKRLFDKEGKEKLHEYSKKTLAEIGAANKKLADRLGFTGNDAKSAAIIIPAVITIWYGSKTKFEVEEATAQKARVKCTNCAFWNFVQAQKITDDICSAKSRYYWEGFAKAINPKLTSTIVKARPLGDSTCEWVFELKA
jgi:hypothetical protein